MRNCHLHTIETTCIDPDGNREILSAPAPDEIYLKVPVTKESTKGLPFARPKSVGKVVSVGGTREVFVRELMLSDPLAWKSEAVGMTRWSVSWRAFLGRSCATHMLPASPNILATSQPLSQTCTAGPWSPMYESRLAC